tara:strand:+ start:446 stop:688 length:243 start_codon:yes stop_codon:yes gene_type:complete
LANAKSIKELSFGNEVLLFVWVILSLIQPKASSLSSQIPLKNKESFEKVSKRLRKLEGDSKLPEPPVGSFDHRSLGCMWF